MARRAVAVIADSYTAQLYRLMGAIAYEASTVEEAARALREVESNANVGVLLVASELYDQLADEIEAVRRRRADLIVSRLPTLRSPGKPMDVQRELLRALGMG